MDRLILYMTRYSRSTWEFDIRAGRWEEQETDTPEGSFGWWSSGEELVYDVVNEVSVLVDTLATYDASEHLWTVFRGGSIWDDPVGDGFMTYDSVNERILVAAARAEEGVRRRAGSSASTS